MNLISFEDTPFVVKLSFDHVIEGMEVQAEGTGERAELARSLLKEVSQYPELREGITSADQVEQHSELISRLLTDYFPAVLTHNEIKAVSVPYRNVVFNHTERFRNILNAAGKEFEINIRDFDQHQFYVLSCCLILNEFYGTQLDFGRPLFYDIPTANGITKHYRILYNADYLEILATDKSLPISPEDIDLLLDNYDNLELWKEKFPKDSWLLKGFAIMTLFDATVENAVSIFKEKLLVLNSVDFQRSVESIFRSIYRIPDIRIGFTVFNQEEGRFRVASFGHAMKSFILPDDAEKYDKEILCMGSFHHLIEKKVFFAVSDTAEFLVANPDSQLASRFLAQDIGSFILAPVVKNNVLLGVVELISPRIKELNSINANKLEVVMPFLTDSIDRLVAELQHQVQAFIQDQFTTIHASVYWKFKQEAQRVIAAQEAGKEETVEEIVFPDVYPLYGQVDIKGSSEARNSSVQNDLKHQLVTLIEILERIEEQEGVESFKDETQRLNYFLNDVSLSLKAGTEQYVYNYIDLNVHPRLTTIVHTGQQQIIAGYFKETDKESGAFHIYRRKYEATIGQINEKLASIIDDRQDEAQAMFPHYYERFKTDGVEHNLYIGASISQLQNFSLEKLYALRLWQLRVLCEMELAHHHLKAELPYPLEVTTLVLVYNTTLSIRFRMDEKRFDVDGSYNARFEIVKKRIDKAMIKDTQKRITHMGRITIVYSSETEAKEYAGYLKILQQEGILGDTIENFEVEDLQGVSGLHAFRATLLH
ncbi:GAF domain-containing protein [Pedobacter sp. L105]|uniref:GAF domain-containing protein n=1 Tax=Pedobacter sp. L105 TaxID=1641871 RepID=UPI00131DC48F|nr:GAF domain-containing protein [Pedobacter sp. L105]